MGTQIAKKLPPIKNLVFADSYISKEFQLLAQSKAARFSILPEDTRGADTIILALNPDQTDEVVEYLCKNVYHPCLIINVSTGKNIEKVPSNFTVANLKIIGEANELNEKECAYVVIPSQLKETAGPLIEKLFQDFAMPLYGNTADYSTINRVVAAITVTAILKIRDTLTEMGFDKKITGVAIRGVMAGTCKGFPWSADDHFINSVFQSLAISPADMNG